VPTAEPVRAWAVDDLLWVRRLAILSQLGRNHRIDVDLLADVIEPNRADSEFFIRKAIGWALREVSYVDPAWVKRYVAAHELSALSRREALKHLSR
jgi:3-methyladenine DNA glycosylase AlkD